MNTVEILKAGKVLIETKGWLQGDFAHDASGNIVFTTDLVDNVGDPVCFCGVGACFAASDTDEGAHRAWDALSAVAPTGAFPQFNDAPGRTREEVLAKFDEAIAAEEAKLAA